MTAKSTQTQSNRNDDVEARVSLIEYQVTVITKGLDEIKALQAATIRQLDTLNNVSNHEFDAYKEAATKTYATKGDLAGVIRLQYWIMGLIAAVFTVGGGAFVGLVLNK